MDSVPIRLRKVLDLGLPTDEEVLSALLERILERGQAGSAVIDERGAATTTRAPASM